MSKKLLFESGAPTTMPPIPKDASSAPDAVLACTIRNRPSRTPPTTMRPSLRVSTLVPAGADDRRRCTVLGDALESSRPSRPKAGEACATAAEAQPAITTPPVGEGGDRFPGPNCCLEWQIPLAAVSERGIRTVRRRVGSCPL
jgi:hypothetical protein